MFLRVGCITVDAAFHGNRTTEELRARGRETMLNADLCYYAEADDSKQNIIAHGSMNVA